MPRTWYRFSNSGNQRSQQQRNNVLADYREKWEVLGYFPFILKWQTECVGQQLSGDDLRTLTERWYLHFCSAHTTELQPGCFQTNLWNRKKRQWVYIKPIVFGPLLLYWIRSPLTETSCNWPAGTAALQYVSEYSLIRTPFCYKLGETWSLEIVQKLTCWGKQKSTWEIPENGRLAKNTELLSLIKPFTNGKHWYMFIIVKWAILFCGWYPINEKWH